VYLRDEKKYSASTVDNYFAALSSFYDFLEWEHVIERNIIPQFRKRYVRYYKVQRHDERQLISLDKMRVLIDSASDIQVKAIFCLFAKTGLRRQELIDLDVGDVKFANNLVSLKHHAKRSNRILFFDDECKAVLLKWLKWRRNHKVKTTSLFVGIQGGRVSRDFIYDVTVDHAKRLGFHDPDGLLCERFTPHCFRHWFTTWMRRSGCPRSIIQELRGDSRSEAIDIYDHISLDEIKEAYLKYMPVLWIVV
jgi:integrase/recombinase XerD